MTWKDRLAVGLLVSALVAVAAGILVPGPAPLPSVTPGSSVTPVHYREGVLGRYSSINPLTARTPVDHDLVALLFRGLVRLGPDGSILPDLADHWTETPDGKTYRFYLRDDAYWHDGIRVTARDVTFTIGLLQDAAYSGPLADAWTAVKVSQESDRIVRFDLGIPKGGFLAAATLPLLPEHVLAGTKAAALADSPFSEAPLGNGPFRIAELDRTHALLERVRSVQPAVLPFSGPPQPTVQPPAPTRYDTLSEIELRFFESAGAMLGEFQAGRLDAVGGLSGANLQVARATAGARVIRYPRPSLTAVILNQQAQHKEFKSADTRSGLLTAIDRDALVTEVLGGFGTRADVPIPVTSWAFDPASVPVLPYDRAAAEASLAKGGWQKAAGSWLPAQDAPPMVVHLVAPDAASNRAANQAALVVAANWRAVGLAVEVTEMPSSQYVEAIRTRSFDAAVVDVDLGLDPDLTPLLASSQAATGGSNLSGYQNTALDKLLASAASKVDLNERRAVMSAVEKFLVANTPILPLYFRDYVFVVSDTVENVSPSHIGDASGRYWDVIDWRLAGDR